MLQFPRKGAPSSDGDVDPPRAVGSGSAVVAHDCACAEAPRAEVDVQIDAGHRQVGLRRRRQGHRPILDSDAVGGEAQGGHGTSFLSVGDRVCGQFHGHLAPGRQTAGSRPVNRQLLAGSWGPGCLLRPQLPLRQRPHRLPITASAGTARNAAPRGIRALMSRARSGRGGRARAGAPRAFSSRGTGCARPGAGRRSRSARSGTGAAARSARR